MTKATAAERMDRAGTSTPPGQSEHTNTLTEQELFGDKGWLDLARVVASKLHRQGNTSTTVRANLVDDIVRDVIDDLMRTWTASKQISDDTTNNWKLAVHRAFQRLPRYVDKHMKWWKETRPSDSAMEAILYKNEHLHGPREFVRPSTQTGVLSSSDEETGEAKAFVAAPVGLFDPEWNTVTREEYYQQTATPPRRRKRVS